MQIAQMTDAPKIQLIDHIGVDLWAAADAWKACYTQHMTGDGYGYFGGAGFAILQFVGPNGARPAEIARRLGISRQAVQQLIDSLEVDGVVTRHPDPEDGRAKIVRLTDKGAKAHWSGNIVKAEIEQRVLAELGAQRLDTLKAELSRVTEILSRHPSAD